MKNEDVEAPSEGHAGDETAATPIAVAVPIDQPDRTVDVDVAITATNAASLAAVQTDEEARALAAAAREEGVAEVRRHCRGHMTQNPESSYVTWIATLHPENARVAIDPRFLVEGNPWMTAYHETLEDLQKGGATSAAGYPGASAPPLQGDSDYIGEQDGRAAKPKRYSGFLDFAVGYGLVVTGAATTIAIEIVSAYAYLSFWLCSKIVEWCFPPGLFTWLPLVVASVIGRTFQFIDMTLLIVSSVVIECIAVINFFTCTILGCSKDVGKHMHQMTRKTSHIVRWAFRQPFGNWDPKRSYCGSRRSSQLEAAEANERPSNS